MVLPCSRLAGKDILARIEDLSRPGCQWDLIIILAAHNWRAKDGPRGLSAMLPTQVCFGVGDDTSGAVALNSRRQGKQAMQLRPPGWGILLLNGHRQVFQSYRFPDVHEDGRGGDPLHVRLEAIPRLVQFPGISEGRDRIQAERWTRTGYLIFYTTAG